MAEIYTISVPGREPFSVNKNVHFPHDFSESSQQSIAELTHLIGAGLFLDICREIFKHSPDVTDIKPNIIEYTEHEHYSSLLDINGIKINDVNSVIVDAVFQSQIQSTLDNLLIEFDHDSVRHVMTILWLVDTDTDSYRTITRHNIDQVAGHQLMFGDVWTSYIQNGVNQHIEILLNRDLLDGEDVDFAKGGYSDRIPSIPAYDFDDTGLGPMVQDYKAGAECADIYSAYRLIRELNRNIPTEYLFSQLLELFEQYPDVVLMSDLQYGSYQDRLVIGLAEGQDVNPDLDDALSQLNQRISKYNFHAFEKKTSLLDTLDQFDHQYLLVEIERCLGQKWLDLRDNKMLLRNIAKKAL